MIIIKLPASKNPNHNICACVCICVCACIHVCICVWMCACVCTCVCMCVCACICVCICVYVCMCRSQSHARSPCEWVFAWSARACDVRAVATADGRLDRIILHGFWNHAQWRGRVDGLPPHWSHIARARTPCEHVFAWSAHTCDLRALAAVATDRRFDRIIEHSFTNRAQ